jgi:hypothetical protein
VGGQLLAEEKIVTGQFVVSFTAEDDQKAWIVNALEQNIYNDLSGYARVVPFQKVIDEDRICKNRGVDCILEIYKELNVDALMLGTVDDSDIEYEIYDVQNKYLVKTGSIEIGSGSSLLILRMGAFKAFKSFIEKGGILDKRKYSVTADGEVNETNVNIVKKDSNAELKNQVLVFLVGFSWFPYLLSFLGKPILHPERSNIALRWFYPFQILCSLIIGYQFILETNNSGNVFDIIFSIFDGYYWILTGIGGIIWGYFIILNFKIVIPRIQGLEQLKPKNISLFMHSSVLTLLIKTLIIIVFYWTFFHGVFIFGRLFSINREVVITLLLPLSGLYIFYWVALVLEVFAMSIDVKLAGRKLNYRNVWDLKVRKYFISYLKRNGVALNRRMVDETVFLKGENKGVVCYGGGFSRPRIAIDKDLIKFALGDMDESGSEDKNKYDQKVIEPVIRQNSLFQITANLSAKSGSKNIFKSRNIKKRTRYMEYMQKYYQRDLELQDEKRNYQSKNVIQGIFYPRLKGDDKFPSLLSGNLDDMRVVEELLLEYSGRNDRYNEDADIDDSSEQDKDFLFGALLHKFGELLRYDNIFSTPYLYLRCKKGVKRKSYNFPFSKYISIVADTFVVLNSGLNHLMQYLYYEATNSQSHLTTKGTASYMLKSQDEILTNTRELIGDSSPLKVQTDELDRIVWLSRFCQDPIVIEDNRIIPEKRLYKWAFSLGVTYLVSLAFINSYIYHPKYLEIIEMEKQEIADAIKDESELERKEQ